MEIAAGASARCEKKSLKKSPESDVRVGEIGVSEMALGGVEGGSGERRRIGGGAWVWKDCEIVAAVAKSWVGVGEAGRNREYPDGCGSRGATQTRLGEGGGLWFNHMVGESWGCPRGTWSM